jgi:hypothetical protein
MTPELAFEETAPIPPATAEDPARDIDTRHPGTRTMNSPEERGVRQQALQRRLTILAAAHGLLANLSARMPDNPVKS